MTSLLELCYTDYCDGFTVEVITTIKVFFKQIQNSKYPFVSSWGVFMLINDYVIYFSVNPNLRHGTNIKSYTEEVNSRVNFEVRRSVLFS